MLTDRINLNEKLRYWTEALKCDGRTRERGDRTHRPPWIQLMAFAEEHQTAQNGSGATTYAAPVGGPGWDRTSDQTIMSRLL